MTIKCIIIEDEPLALEQMEDYVGKVDFLQLERSFSNAIEPARYLKENDIDLIFLDIEMEDFTGLQFLKSLTHKPQIILTTAYDNYALEAFDLDVSDYLLKPISFDRFLRSANKVYDNLKSPVRGSETPETTSIIQDYIFVRTEYRMEKIHFKDILFVEGKKEYLRIHSTSKKVMTLMSFKKLLGMLSDNFVRVHNSYIVSLDKIETIENQRLKIGEHMIPVSNSYKTGFYELLKDRNLM
ncbi:MAG: LytTR family DNA-binding domain-containing protein [Crocinitomicaceae bacterium]|nr:LytTR family DNA-binding domain-containing protein [Crocinitomicaceae bacterium]